MAQAHDIVFEELDFDTGEQPDWASFVSLVETNEEIHGKPKLKRVK